MHQEKDEKAEVVVSEMSSQHVTTSLWVNVQRLQKRIK